MAFCRNCGSKLNDGEAKCPNCGFEEITVERGPIKASTGLMVAMWIFCVLGGLIGIIISASVLGAKNADRTPKYDDRSRSQAKTALFVAIGVMVLSLIIQAAMG